MPAGIASELGRCSKASLSWVNFISYQHGCASQAPMTFEFESLPHRMPHMNRYESLSLPVDNVQRSLRIDSIIAGEETVVRFIRPKRCLISRYKHIWNSLLNVDGRQLRLQQLAVRMHTQEHALSRQCSRAESDAPFENSNSTFSVYTAECCHFTRKRDDAALPAASRP